MKAAKSGILLLLCLMFTFSLRGQDPVLFTVNDRPVQVSEFKYIYEKNNAQNADYSEQSLREYLELYKNFKLKVEAAREAGLDTLPALKSELAGYRKQLSDAYLVDKKAEDALVQEAYERIQEDREIAHILLRYPSKASAEDKNRIMEKARDLREKLAKGATWSDVVSRHSEDDQSKINQGYLGWFTALLPRGFYDLETVIYQTEIGQISEPVTSNLGVHIVKVLDSRPARGKILAAHILIRKKKDPKESEVILDSIYTLLQNGADFGELAAKFSEDKDTKNNKGLLGYVGINQYEQNFEDKLFALENDGDFSKPIASSVGHHILQRVQKQDYSNKEAMKRSLRSRIAKDPRSEVAKQKLISEIKETAGMYIAEEAKNKYRSALDQTFFKYSWDAPKMPETQIIGFEDGTSFTGQDLTDYLKSRIRDRLRATDKIGPQAVFDDLFQDFEDYAARKYEEMHLEEKYPEFKALMREYSEGILLFEITKENVWDKASEDSLGIKKYFYKNRDQYTWDPRARVFRYTVDSDNEKLLKKSYKKSIKKDNDFLEKKYGEEPGFASSLIIMEKSELPESMTIENGSTSEIITLENGKSQWYKIDALLPAAKKSLKDCRGPVIADYQKHLEEEWIKNLSQRYEVDVNEKVLNALIKNK